MYQKPDRSRCVCLETDRCPLYDYRPSYEKFWFLNDANVSAACVSRGEVRRWTFARWNTSALLHEICCQHKIRRWTDLSWTAVFAGDKEDRHSERREGGEREKGKNDSRGGRKIAKDTRKSFIPFLRKSILYARSIFAIAKSPILLRIERRRDRLLRVFQSWSFHGSRARAPPQHGLVPRRIRGRVYDLPPPSSSVPRFAR